MHDFVKFGKIPRFFRGVTVTEKIDGTNGQICIGEDGEFLVGSRNRWITPENDNAGFAAWAYSHREYIVATLGVGTHYGEWWGYKIQRGYGLTERRFSLFNVDRWKEALDYEAEEHGIHTVPLLKVFDVINTSDILTVMEDLKSHGSYAASGFDNPEGIVLRHNASGHLYKYTFGGDGHKGVTG